jgi:predicted DNA-binding transcriptional regulator AlpA
MIDRIVRPGEAKEIHGLSDVHVRRLEEADAFPRRFKICPDSGKYGATGWMLSWLQSWNQWRAAGGHGSWTEWWAAAERDARVAEQAAERVE